MHNKLIALLFFSHVLLAHADSDVQTAAVHNDMATLVQNDFDDAAEVQQIIDTNTPERNELLASGEFQAVNPIGFLAQNDVYASNEMPDAAASNSLKWYENLIKMVPMLDDDQKSVEQKNEVTDTFSQKEEVKTAVMKFAAMPRMRSSIVLIYDENGKQPFHSKNADVVTPIASITKLMTAMVVLDAKLPLDEEISISSQDINRIKRTRSRTQTGMTMTRGELLKLALMASDNLSAAALARTYPGGTEAALVQMNVKARELGMNSSRFMDPTGLNSGNVSTANDLVKMVRAAQHYELIHQFTTSTSHTFERAGHRPVQFHNTNPLVKNASWDIGLSKTGYISEAGRCLVMEATISEQPVIIVLLDSWGRNSRVGDANRVKKWMEKASLRGQNARNM